MSRLAGGGPQPAGKQVLGQDTLPCTAGRNPAHQGRAAVAQPLLVQGAEQARAVPPALAGSGRGLDRADLPPSQVDGATASVSSLLFSSRRKGWLGRPATKMWAPPVMLTPNPPLSPVLLAGWASANNGLWLCPAIAADLLPEILWKYIQSFSELLDGTPQPLQRLETVLPHGAAQTPNFSMGSSLPWAVASWVAQPRMVLLSHCLWMGHPRGASRSHREVIEVVPVVWAGRRLGGAAGREGTQEWGEIGAGRRAAVIFHFSADPQKPAYRSSCRSNTWI